MKTLTPSSATDYFLLEMELAIKYYQSKLINIYPLLVGSTDDTGGFVGFDGSLFNRLSEFPDCESPSSHRSSRMTVRETLTMLFGIQGIKLADHMPTDEQLTDFVKWMGEMTDMMMHGDVMTLMQMTLLGTESRTTR